MYQAVISVLIALSLSWTSFSSAQPQGRPLGLSAFAASSPRFPCAKYLRQVNKSRYPIMPVLWGTFGADIKCINRFIKTNAHRPHIVEVHLQNGPCEFNSRCGPYERSYAHNYIDLMGKVRPLAKTSLWLSPVLEDRLTPEQFEIAVHFLENYTLDQPWISRVRSPIGPRPIPHGWLKEAHGTDKSNADITNNDGTVVFLDTMQKFHSQHDNDRALILWTPDLQGVSKRFVDPRKRQFQLTMHTKVLWNKLLELERR